MEIGSSFDNHSLSATVTIIDHGIGIGDKDLPHIFDEYFYTPRAALHNRTSSGIGLSIVKTVAENNKLNIRVSSEQNVGTIFSVVFQGAKSAPAMEKSVQQTESLIARPANPPVELPEPDKDESHLAPIH